METALDRRRAQVRRLRRWRRRGAWTLVAVATLALLGGLPWLVVQGPYHLDGRADSLMKDPATATGGAALVTGLRTAVVATMAAIGAGIALVYTVRNYRLTRRGQITDRFTKALERLGSEEIYVRIGGVLALEQIVQDAPEQATHAAQVLGHVVRERSPAARRPQEPDAAERGKEEVDKRTPTEELPRAPAADVQATLTALSRPESRVHVDPRDTLDLSGLHLTGAQLAGADLSRAILPGADLSRAILRGADFTGADLHGTDLFSADLSDANFTRALMSDADLGRAILHSANLTAASLDEADLTGAQLYAADLIEAVLRDAILIHAQLFGANLYGADISGANLGRAVLHGVDLTNADLSRAALTATDLHNVNFTRTKLHGTDLTDANLARANLADAEGLMVDQVRVARIDKYTRLPEEIAAELEAAG